MEYLFGHINLTPDDEPGGGIRDFERDRAHSAQILGDILPYLTVPTGGSPNK